MDLSVDEIAADVFRIAYYAPELDFTFNQYLVRDEEPLLYHTGFRKMFGETSSAVRRSSCGRPISSTRTASRPTTT